LPSSSIGTTVAKKQSEKSENYGDHDLVTGWLAGCLLAYAHAVWGVDWVVGPLLFPNN
jgi:hypothetical protein